MTHTDEKPLLSAACATASVLSNICESGALPCLNPGICNPNFAMNATLPPNFLGHVGERWRSTVSAKRRS